MLSWFRALLPKEDNFFRLFDAHAVDGRVAFEYQTRAFIGTLD